MASKTAAKGRAKGAGSVYKNRNRFYWKFRTNERTITKLLFNEDGSYCTTVQQAMEAANRLYCLSQELVTEEAVTAKLAEIRQKKKVLAFKPGDIWEAFMNNPNRPDCSETHRREQKREFDKFLVWLKKKGIVTADEITNEVGGEYMARLGANVSNRCFNVYLGFLKLIFGLSYKAVGLVCNPFEEIKRRKEETESRQDFTPEQVTAIFDGFRNGFFYETEVERMGADRKHVRVKKRLEYRPMFAPEMEVLLKICCYTGADGQSGCLMKWDGVDFKANTISYVREKTKRATGGRVITLPIHPELRAALESAKAWAVAGNLYVLPNVAERYKRNHWGVQADVKKIISCALNCDVTNRNPESKRKRAANVYSLHSFRHTFVSFCTNAGVSLDIVAEFVGHGNPVMTRHYSHIHDDAKQRAIQALPNVEEPKDVTDAADEMARDDLRTLAGKLPIESVREILKKYPT